MLALSPGKPDFYFKLLSVDPANYEDATIEGIRRVLSHFRGGDIPRGEPLHTRDVAVIRMGTTVATNALLERKGSKCAILITKGFGDLMIIGDQSRPNLFDLNVRKPGELYERSVEIDERVTPEAFAEDPLERSFTETINGIDIKRGVTGEAFRVLKPLGKTQALTCLMLRETDSTSDEAEVTKQLEDLYGDGFRSIAVCLIHGYDFQGKLLDSKRSLYQKDSHSYHLEQNTRK